MVDEVFIKNVLDRVDHLTQLTADNHADMSDRMARLETELQGLPRRVASLEKTRSRLLGAIAAFAFVITSVLSFFGLKK